MQRRGIWTRLLIAGLVFDVRADWAGTGTSEIFNGHMDGAVRSGERVAREVRLAL